MAHADLYYREIINNGKEACSGKNSKNTELTIRFIGAVYDHVFVSNMFPVMDIGLLVKVTIWRSLSKGY